MNKGPSPWPGIFLILLVFVSAAVRTLIAQTVDLTDLEAYQSALAAKLEATYLDQPPLYVWLIHFIQKLPLPDPLAIRTLSLLLFSLSLILLFDIGRRLFNPSTGLVACLLIHLSPSLFLNGCLALPDSLSLFLHLGLWLCLLIYIEKPTSSVVILSSVLLGLGLLTHSHFILSILCLSLVLLCYKTKAPVSHFFLFLIFPLSAFVFQVIHQWDHGLPLFMNEIHSLFLQKGTFDLFALRDTFLSTAGHISPWLLTCCFLALFLLSILSSISPQSKLRFGTGICLIFSLPFILFYFLTGFTQAQTAFYDHLGWVAAVLLLACGLHTLWPKYYQIFTVSLIFSTVLGYFSYTWLFEFMVHQKDRSNQWADLFLLDQKLKNNPDLKRNSQNYSNPWSGLKQEWESLDLDREHFVFAQNWHQSSHLAHIQDSPTFCFNSNKLRHFEWRDQKFKMDQSQWVLLCFGP